MDTSGRGERNGHVEAKRTAAVVSNHGREATDRRGGPGAWGVSCGGGTPARSELEPGVRLAQAVLALRAYPEVTLKDVTFPYT